MPRKPAAAEAEATARAINAEPWKPPAGIMVKRQCPKCRYFFVSPADSTEQQCADCAAIGTGRDRTVRQERADG